jgi:hypothetical protein
MQQTTPVAVSGLTDVAQIGAGIAHSLAITSSGELDSWGANAAGQLGDGTTTERSSAVTVISAAPTMPTGPSVHFSWTYAIVTLTPKEQRVLLSADSSAISFLAGALFCSEGGPEASLACGLGAAWLGGALSSAVQQYLADDNCVVRVRINYFPPGIADSWRDCY